MSKETQTMVPENAEPVYQLWSDEGFGGWTDTDKATYCWWLDSKNPPRMRKLYTAPVAAQPDVTQQTLDDVMAGIPARDAEIEALRKEIETLRAAQAQQPVSGADRLPIELCGISEAIGNGGGFWRSCSGCHESNEGMATGPFSETFKCHLGVGCSECGGIGAIWDTTDYDAMADFMAAKDQQNVENTETVVCLCNASQGQDADKVDAEIDKAFEAVRKQLNKLPRYSFYVRSGGVNRAEDKTGNWIEWEKAHSLFDPVSVDAARKEQA
ncbi:hypothetical protein [Alcaligenes faecalis]|uniref:hypothetical protein n=1 Tax=Alcaligenes faecalis TaxID=511 RepID=UPI00215016DA|nr:hypothetical protein [Alcaligenes faecalis]MCR4146225.1 hypothetical protein [Alcaligenes faecalis]